LVYFPLLPRAAAIDFRAQMAASRFAGWMALPAAGTALSGFFRQDRKAKILTIVFGAGLCFLWVVIAAGNFPVA
jgi:hypothetical protein